MRGYDASTGRYQALHGGLLALREVDVVQLGAQIIRRESFGLKGRMAARCPCRQGLSKCSLREPRLREEYMQVTSRDAPAKAGPQMACARH